MISPNYLTATETQIHLANGSTTLERVIKDHQERYQQRNEQIKAWVCVDHTILNDKAVEGPLRGMVIGIKDIISMSQPSRITKLTGRYQRLPN